MQQQPPEQAITSYFSQLEKLKIDKKPAICPLSYFFAGFLSEPYSSRPRGLYTLFETFYVLQKLEKSRIIPDNQRDNVFMEILDDSNTKIEKNLNSLMIEQNRYLNITFFGEENDIDEKSYILNEIQRRASLSTDLMPLDFIFWGYCARKHPTLISEINEKLNKIAKVSDSSLKLKLQASIYNKPDTDIEHLLSQDIKINIEEIKVEPSEKQLINALDAGEGLKPILNDKGVNLTGHDCQICLEDFIEDRAYCKLELCDHVFHKSCTLQHIQAKMADQSFPATCPQAGCNAELTDSDLREILSEEAVRRYYELSILHFTSRDLVPVFQCPTADCVFKSFETKKEQTHILCPYCQITFCLKCKEKEHGNVPCEISQFMNTAVKIGLKMCPYCRRWVEKKEGCNHMVCYCGSKFCYNCGVINKYGRCLSGNCEGADYYQVMKEMMELQEAE